MSKVYDQILISQENDQKRIMREVEDRQNRLNKCNSKVKHHSQSLRERDQQLNQYLESKVLEMRDKNRRESEEAEKLRIDELQKTNSKNAKIVARVHQLKKESFIKEKEEQEQLVSDDIEWRKQNNKK